MTEKLFVLLCYVILDFVASVEALLNANECIKVSCNL